MAMQRRMPRRPAHRSPIVSRARAGRMHRGRTCGLRQGRRHVEKPRPVLVVHAGQGARGRAGRPIAGEVRAREESPLSFRVGGRSGAPHWSMPAIACSSGEVLAELDPERPARCRRRPRRRSSPPPKADLARAGARPRPLREAGRATSWSAVRRYDAQNAAYAAAEGQARAARAQLDVARNQAAYSQLRAPRDGVIASARPKPARWSPPARPSSPWPPMTAAKSRSRCRNRRIREFSVGQPVLVELWNAARRAPARHDPRDLRRRRSRRRAPTPRASPGRRRGEGRRTRPERARLRAATTGARRPRCACRCRRCSAAPRARPRCGWSIRRRATVKSHAGAARAVTAKPIGAGAVGRRRRATGSSPPAGTCCAKARRSRRSTATTARAAEASPPLRQAN